MSVRIRDRNNIPNLTKELGSLAKRKIKAGIMGKNDMTMIAAVHEFGARIPVTDKMRAWFAAQGYPLRKETTHIIIPERSFIRAGFDENEREFIKHARMVLIEAMAKGTPMDTVLDALGLQLKGMIQTYMRDLSEPPLSKMTKAMTGRDNPLIHTGHLLRAIVHEVV